MPLATPMSPPLVGLKIFSEENLSGLIYMNSYSTKTKQLVSTHEMGDILGLRDINKTSSIMHYNTNFNVSVVTKDAHDAINEKYWEVN